MLVLQFHPTRLELRDPFRVSYGTSHFRENLIISLSDGVYTGYGEAAAVFYYGDTLQSLRAQFDSPIVAEILQAPLDLEHLGKDLLPQLPSRARAALDMALHDLWGQQQGESLHQHTQNAPLTSYTIAITEDEADFRRRIEAAQDFALLKIKLGSGDFKSDLARVAWAREIYGGQIAVDANGAWTVAETFQALPHLEGILYLEQPIAKENLEGWRELRQIPLPLIADEAVQTLESLYPLLDVVNGINIKLAKCGGIYAAKQMIDLARKQGLKVMIGCMVESSVAISAAASLAPRCDFADLDSNLLIANDPFSGVRADSRGRLRYPQGTGLGLTPLHQLTTL